MRQKHVMMHGPPGAGKTTLANNISNDPEIMPWRTPVFSIDEARRVAGFDPLKAREREELTEGMYAGVEYSIGILVAAGLSVVSDNTHPSRETRDRERRIVERLKPGGLAVVSFCISVVTPPEERLRRVLEREDLGANVRHTVETFQRVTSDFEKRNDQPEREEGLIIVQGMLPYDDPGLEVDQRRQILEQSKNLFLEL